MADQVDQLAEALRRLTDLEQQVVKTKKFINQCREFLGQPPQFLDVDLESLSALAAPRSDEFYGQPLAQVVRTILERRRLANLGAASVPEIYRAMKEGGFHFNTKNESNAIRSLRNSLAKNTAAFHRVPNGDYGLRDWYPKIRERRASEPDDSRESMPQHIEEATEDEQDNGVVSLVDLGPGKQKG